MEPSDKRTLDEILIAACHHVLPQCGIPMGVYGKGGAAERAGAPQLASVIGFSARGMLGTLTLMAPLSLVRLSYPLALTETGSDQLELFDWFGEVTNRLMGRIKRGVAQHGMLLEPSTPTVMLAEHVPPGILQNPVCDLQFAAGESHVHLLVAAMCLDGVVLLQGSAGADESVAEGDVLLF